MSSVDLQNGPDQRHKSSNCESLSNRRCRRILQWFNYCLASSAMFRCTLTLVVIAGYLAGQLATVPHVHAAEHSGHARSHAHGDWFTRFFKTNHHSHSQAHSHSHEGFGSHHSHDEHEHPAPPSPSDKDHDSSCVYLPDLDVANAPSKSMDQSAKVSSIAVVIEATNGLSSSMLLSAIQSKAPPDGLLLGCPRFLKLRTLRI